MRVRVPKDAFNSLTVMVRVSMTAYGMASTEPANFCYCGISRSDKLLVQAVCYKPEVVGIDSG
jgi:hypothetical protein